MRPEPGDDTVSFTNQNDTFDVDGDRTADEMARLSDYHCRDAERRDWRSAGVWW